MNIHDKFQMEKQILMSLIERYKQSDEPGALSMVMAYEYGLQALTEVYVVSQQEEVIPF
ncbi:hypothetical protein ACQVPC_25895 [Bacillus mycoides]|uniref:hypothetical protein n=2 Tax=Bacillaceae TaxID=186817 RepID=UPI0015D14F87|nr:hypothetical protein [Bacillus mycoides]HDR7616993.1 hypothetical protein [Bacillus mycoides]